tara:strand:+ start:47 stop:667 length:621 start_codon:yes stop_codon:yes gene_type:complete
MVKTRRNNRRCKECRCKPCKCKEEIHCYQITCSPKRRKRTKKRPKRVSQKGGYPFWFDKVPKGMSRDQYKRLEKSKPKNKSMKGWIKENKSKRVSQKGGFLPIAALGCGPCLAGPALAVTGLGTAGYVVSRSSNTKTVNGKTVHTRKESYKLKKNGKQIKKVFLQKNNRIYLNKKELMPRPKTMKEATKRLNKKIKECVESGFKKC